MRKMVMTDEEIRQSWRQAKDKANQLTVLDAVGQEDSRYLREQAVNLSVGLLRQWAERRLGLDGKPNEGV